MSTTSQMPFFEVKDGPFKGLSIVNPEFIMQQNELTITSELLEKRPFLKKLLDFPTPTDEEYLEFEQRVNNAWK